MVVMVNIEFLGINIIVPTSVKRQKYDWWLMKIEFLGINIIELNSCDKLPLTCVLCEPHHQQSPESLH